MEALVVIAIFFIAFLWDRYGTTRRSRSVEVWEEFARNNESELEQSEGRVQNEDDIGSVRLKRGGRSILATGYPKEQTDATVPASQVVIHIHSFKADLWIAYNPERWLRPSRGNEITTGYEDFDKLFEVSSANELWTKRALSTGGFLREELMENKKKLSISLQSGRLTVDKIGAPKFAEELDDLVDLALDIAELFENTTVPSLIDQRRAAGALTLSEEEDAEGALTVADAPDGAISPADKEGGEG